MMTHHTRRVLMVGLALFASTVLLAQGLQYPVARKVDHVDSYHGTKVVTISPDYSPSAIHSDLWVPVNVGSDAAHPELCGRCVSNLFGDGEERWPWPRSKPLA